MVYHILLQSDKACGFVQVCALVCADERIYDTLSDGLLMRFSIARPLVESMLSGRVKQAAQAASSLGTRPITLFNIMGAIF